MKSLKIFLWIIVLAVLLMGVMAYWQYQMKHPSTDDAYVQAHVVNIAPQINGPIQAIYITNQQLVKQGDLLFMIDPTPFEIAVQNAEAKLDLTAQNVASLEAAIKTAEALIDQRPSQRHVTIKNANRVFDLVRIHQLPKKQGDDAENDINVAKAALASANSQLTEAKANLGELGKQNAQIRAAKAALDQAKLNLSYTKIIAPANGQIVNFTSRVGDIVQPNIALFDLVEQSSWWVDANFKETQLSRLKPGLPATIIVDMYPDHVFHGLIDSISPGSGAAFAILPPENATGNWVKVTQRIPVKVIITDTSTDFPLRIGSSATVTINTQTKG
jgi:membrane fusion protein (multidrug efflux system)